LLPFARQPATFSLSIYDSVDGCFLRTPVTFANGGHPSSFVPLSDFVEAREPGGVVSVWCNESRHSATFRVEFQFGDFVFRAQSGDPTGKSPAQYSLLLSSPFCKNILVFRRSKSP
jgi:hypothetical protein